MRKPVETPTIAEGVWDDVWPQSNDRPPNNLYTADGVGDAGIHRIVIPRHGSTGASAAPRNLPRQLPGGILIGYFDGHAKYTELEQLWNLYWHVNYTRPLRRPR